MAVNPMEDPSYWDNFGQAATPQATASANPMENPNYWVKYDNGQMSPGVATMNHSNLIPPTTPLNHYSLIDAFKAAPQHAKDSLKKFIGGVWNTYAHPIESSEALVNAVEHIPSLAVSTAAGAALNALTPEARALVVAQTPAETQTMLNKASSTAGNLKDTLINYGGKNYGSWDAFKRSIAERPIQTAADASIPLSMGATALDSAGLAALRTAGEGMMVSAGVPGPVARGVGALVNPLALPAVVSNPLNVLVPAGKGVAAATRFGVNALTPQRRAMLKAVDGQGEEVIQQLRDAVGNQIVPGVNPMTDAALGPNAATGSQGVNSPILVRMAQKAQANLPQQAEAIRDANALAQMKQVQRVGGTFDIDPLNAIREDASNTNYGISNAINSKITDDLQHILTLPLNKSVAKDAKAIATQNSRPFTIGGEMPPYPANWDVLQTKWPSSHTVAKTSLDGHPQFPGKPDLLGMVQTPESRVFNPEQFKLADLPGANDPHLMFGVPPTLELPGIPTPNPYLPGHSLHDIKKAFDGLISKASTSSEGLDPTKMGDLMDAKQQFLEWAARPENNPSYNVGRLSHEFLSGQIDRAALRNALMEQLQAGPEQFGNALDNAVTGTTGVNPLVKKLTGRDAQLSDKLTPGEMNLLKSVSDEHLREEWARTKGRAANQNASDLTNAASDGADASAPSVLGKGATVVNALKNVLASKADPRVSMRMSRNLIHPADTADMISNALAQQAMFDRIGWGIRTKFNALNAPNRYPTIYNIIQQQRDDQQNAMSK